MSDLARLRAHAERVLNEHLGPEWSFRYDNAKRRAGLCDFTHKRLSLSRYLAARYDDETNHQTLLHEVAHALSGPTAGHGAEWKRIARGLGYTGGTTHHGETATELAPWVGTCPNGHVVYRYRKATRATSCARCARHYDARFLLTWERREISAATRLAARTPR